MQREAPAIFGRHGVTYPVELERAMLGRVTRHLRAMNLMPEPADDERYRVRVDGTQQP